MLKMRNRWKRFCIILGFCTIYLFVHMYLSVNNIFTPRIVNKITRDFEEYIRGLKKTQADYSQKFLILYSPEHYIEPKNAFGVTLVTQCSVNHLHHIVDLARAWQGPVSVAVFIEPNEVMSAIVSISLMRYCLKDVQIYYHLVVVKRDYEYLLYQTKDVAELIKPCDSFVLQGEEKEKRNFVRNFPYPINLLRNVAKDGSNTQYTFVVDADMIPSKNLKYEFELYLRRQDPQSHNTIYVVPAFEMDKNLNEMPVTKMLLSIKYEEGSVRPFYSAVCPKCHNQTNYPKWFSLTEPLGVKPAYDVVYKDPWEPFFISRRDVPSYDPRFQNYGFNRISQICELYIAGYQFRVLENAFLIHNGFKLASDFHDTKDAENKINLELYIIVKVELQSKYPQTSRYC